MDRECTVIDLSRMFREQVEGFNAKIRFTRTLVLHQAGISCQNGNFFSQFWVFSSFQVSYRMGVRLYLSSRMHFKFVIRVNRAELSIYVRTCRCQPIKNKVPS